MKLFWFSFSLLGINQGICIIEEEIIENALTQAHILGIVPKCDDIKAFEMTKMDDGLEANILYSRQEMLDRGYSSH